MDDRRFDALTRGLAGNTSRRSVTRSLLGGIAAAFGLKGVAEAAPAGKVEICHYSKSTNTFAPIQVNGNAVSSHMAHGDQICTNPANGASSCTSSGCTVTCDAGYDVCDSGCCVHVPVCDPECTNPANGTSACTDSGCVVTCDAGYHTCVDGCCQDGPVCDPVCADPENGTSTCTYSGCEITCNTGYHNCIDYYGNDACCQTCNSDQFECRSTGCCDVPPGMCWWLNNEDPFDWQPQWGDSYTDCRDSDNCRNGGACYKWTVNQNDSFDFSDWIF